MCVCVCDCQYVCRSTSVWQDEVCNTMKAIMHLRHVSLGSGGEGGMGAERLAGWWSSETSSAGARFFFFFPPRATQETLRDWNEQD